MTDILYYWKIGRFMFNAKDSCINIHAKCSDYLSYYYGNSINYSLVNINLIRKLYLYFPIYLDCMDKINWDSYLEMLKLDKKRCYFYYNILLFCGDNSTELKKLINNNLYERI